jgi:hypothetical protein
MIGTGTVSPGLIWSSACRTVSAAARRSRFSAVSRGQMSRSCVRRVAPWCSVPHPPTTTYSTDCWLSASIALSGSNTPRARSGDRRQPALGANALLLAGDERPRLVSGRWALHPHQNGAVIRRTRRRIALGATASRDGRRQLAHRSDFTVEATAIETTSQRRVTLACRGPRVASQFDSARGTVLCRVRSARSWTSAPFLSAPNGHPGSRRRAQEPEPAAALLDAWSRPIRSALARATRERIVPTGHWQTCAASA